MNQKEEMYSTLRIAILTSTHSERRAPIDQWMTVFQPGADNNTND